MIRLRDARGRVSGAALGMGLLGLVALGANACTGVIGDGSVEGEGGEPCIGCEEPPGEVANALVETSRFPRLSHAQWERTVQDLFYLSQPTGLSANFTGDPLGGVFDNNESVLLVSPPHWQSYQGAAEEIATAVANDPALLAGILPADMPTDPEAQPQAYIEHFGKRAYRRPLTQDEVAAYLALFAQAPTLLDGDDDFVLGVELTLQAFLQSPHFLYRVQSSSEVGDNGFIALSGWEIASKLSYMIWNTMPDETLFAAAESGELDTVEGIMTQAERLLNDDKAKPMVAAFHAQLYQFDHYHDLYKDPDLFPDFPADVGDDMEHEAELFVEEIVFEGGGLTELLTSPVTYVNADLAALYGLEGEFGETFERVELDPAERTGLLTRLGFLAANATPREQNTIHRGVFVNARVLCNELPSPPDNVTGLPPAENFATNRERVEAHTGPGTCGAGCHQTLINPPGYALEHYNAVGAFQLLENGNEVNASADYILDGSAVSFDGAIEMSELFADSKQAHRCYAKHWLEYAYGRLTVEDDDQLLDDLSSASAEGSVKNLILSLTQTLAFRSRAPLSEEGSP